MVLSTILALSLLVSTLQGLSIPSTPSVILPPSTDISVFPPTSNLTTDAEWPVVPFTTTYFHDQCALRILQYGRSDRVPNRIQVTQGFDVIIYHIVRSRKEMYQPSDPPLVVLEGIVTLCITFVTATSSIQLALAVQTLRDLMYYKYEPREIESAHFGWNGPWVPMALFALKFTVSEKEQVPVDGS